MATLATVVTLVLSAGPAGATGDTVTPGYRGLLTGSFRGVSGTAESGATITVTAWPNNATLDNEAEGATVPTKTVQVATTDSSGNYALSPDLSSLPSTYVEPDGTVNLDVDATSSQTGDSQDWGFSAAVAGSPALATNPNVLTAGVSSDAVNFDLNAATILTSVNGATPVSTTDPTTAQATTGTDSYNTDTAVTVTPAVTPDDNPPKPYNYCTGGWVNAKFFPNRQEKFLNLYTYGNADVEEEVGTSHTLGIGVAVTGGGWSASGTHTIENSKSTFGGDTYGRNYQLSNHVNYHHYTELCHKAFTGAQYYKHKVEATSVHTLLDVQTAITNRNWNSSYCTLYHSGHQGKNHGTNQTFSTGVSAPYINLSAEVAFSTDTTVTWYPPSQGEQLCGTTSSGFGGAPFAGGEAQPRSGCDSGGYVSPATQDGDDTATGAVAPDC